MARISRPVAEQFSADLRPVFERLAAQMPDRLGPQTVHLQHPLLSERLFALSTQLSSDPILARPIRELVILTVSQETEGRYEWWAHVGQAEKAGATPEAIAALRDGAPTTRLRPREAAAIDAVRALARRHTVNDAEFANLQAHFTTAEIVELLVVAGYYTLLSFLLATFQIEPPEDQEWSRGV